MSENQNVLGTTTLQWVAWTWRLKWFNHLYWKENEQRNGLWSLSKDAAVHTLFVTCSSRNETHHLTCTLDLMIAIILIHRP